MRGREEKEEWSWVRVGARWGWDRMPASALDTGEMEDEGGVDDPAEEAEAKSALLGGTPRGSVAEAGREGGGDREGV